MYSIRMGVPEMQALWEQMTAGYDAGTLKKDELQFFGKWTKAMSFLRDNPRHPSLKTHDIDAMTRRYGFKIWQSYLENKKSGARRMFWTYGPGRNEISILGVEPHSEDSKRGSYERIKLSDLPPFQY